MQRSLLRRIPKAVITQMIGRRDQPVEYCKTKPNRYPFYSPRFWNGMRMGDYARLLAENRFKISPQKYAMTVLVGACALMNSTFAGLQRITHSRKIAKTEIQPPVFVIGHWRSGTTLLHELLSLDQQFGYPTTLQCFVPHHCLVSWPMLHPLISLLLPKKRPMDNMAAGPAMPQEDEFAFCALGAPTPYRQMAFCQQSPVHLDLLNMTEASAPHEIEFKEALEYFYKVVSYKTGKKLVLKSPPHTGRIAFLKSIFPEAKFIHITRNPYKVFPSTVHLWRSLFQVQSYQMPVPGDDQIGAYVHDCYEEMYAGYFAQCDQIADQDLVEVSFESLVSEPVSQITRIYDQLGLEFTDGLGDLVNDYVCRRKDHQVNETELDELTQREIDRRWQKYIQRYQYEPVATG